jgi:hypothetical protein
MMPLEFVLHRYRLRASGVPCRYWHELNAKEQAFWLNP